ncbi:Dolichyldiphosphatase 1 [Eumeta japonica]|uniref:Dolichyldiphosphatase n=1 Tax=Eumeta variegata TaxID=151549 RepID=A0A4C1VPP2_EUMVA|nr:Dolichyldiphosphatase 1 [Eumeta japonica]
MDQKILQIKEVPGDEIEWQPLALTLVEYPKGDWFGKCLALLSLAPFGIGSGFIALILFRRDLHTIAFFLGTLINELVNVILKHIICEARPLARGHLYTEYGMPSSHAQFIWFFTFYVLYFVVISTETSSMTVRMRVRSPATAAAQVTSTRRRGSHADRRPTLR